mmetsp:Transcript_13410/g.11492  ORF Transcript_13410/g.11492 Transcript_13410/m.11492 type:complete len:99 (+) Transcript_13410:172-468(+)
MEDQVNRVNQVKNQQQGEIERLNRALADNRAEKEKLANQLAEYGDVNAQNNELQNKIGLLINENERLNNFIGEKQRELDNWAQRCGDLEKKLASMNEL